MSDARKIVVVGAGMVGVSAAYHLTVRGGFPNVVLVDEREPLTLTSDKGTGAYRNWWPDAAMVPFIGRSIELLEALACESSNAFGLTRPGYLMLTADRLRIEELRKSAAAIAASGAGELREHTRSQTYEGGHREGGADLLLGGELVRHHFGVVSPDVVAALHIRQAGFLRPAALGAWMRERFEAAGGTILRAKADSFSVASGQVRGIRLPGGDILPCDALVLSPGPLLGRLLELLDVDMPLSTELHLKLTMTDLHEALPVNYPLLIWSDPLHGKPSGAHVRPRMDEDDQKLVALWNYAPHPAEATWPPPVDPDFVPSVLRALEHMVPALRGVTARAGEAHVDGGYYCKTPDERPLIGRLPVEGAYVCAAMSGYGIMGAQAAGELLAAHVAGGELPDWAGAFDPARTFAAKSEPGYRSAPLREL